MTDRRQQRNRIVGDARANLSAELRRDYEGGATIRALSEEHSLSYGLARDLLVQAGTEMRPRGGGRRVS